MSTLRCHCSIVASRVQLLFSLHTLRWKQCCKFATFDEFHHDFSTFVCKFFVYSSHYTNADFIMLKVSAWNHSNTSLDSRRNTLCGWNSLLCELEEKQVLCSVDACTCMQMCWFSSLVILWLAQALNMNYVIFRWNPPKIVSRYNKCWKMNRAANRDKMSRFEFTQQTKSQLMLLVRYLENCIFGLCMSVF